MNDFHAQAACTSHADVFLDPDRDREALAVCRSCPVLTECRAWALQTDVAGVCGGLAEWERPTFLLDVPSRTDERRQAVAALTAKGLSTREIAGLLGLSARVVTRYRSSMREAPVATVKRLPDRKVARCGTDAGYHRHRTQKTPTCPECREAHATAERERNARKRTAA